MIYFVQENIPGEDWTLIKIGTTKCLTERLKSLRIERESELKVLGVMDGSFEMERAIHRRFRQLRQEGEWFYPHESLLEFIGSKAREWDGVDEVIDDRVVVKIDRATFRRAKIVALSEGRSVSEWLRDNLIPVIEESEQAFAERILKESIANG